VFNLGEITRLMKFPGVAKTFIVKIISGLPSGEHIYQLFLFVSLNYKLIIPHYTVETYLNEMKIHHLLQSFSPLKAKVGNGICKTADF